MAGITIGSRIKKSPYYEATLAAGVTHFTIYNRMYMPTSFGDALGEYERLTTAVSLWDVGAERQVEIVGPDARSFTQYVTCRDVLSLKPGRARYTPMADYDGNLTNDPIAMCLAEDQWWLSIADSDMVLFCNAVAGAKGFDVRISEPDVSPLAIQGPLALDLGRDLFGADTIDSLGFFHHRPTELDGIPMVICRSGWSRQGGLELFLTDGSRGTELWDKVIGAGERYGIGPGGPHQMERIESGLLSYRSDTDDRTSPIEAGLERWVDLDGDDFVGREAIAARHADPTGTRLLVNVYVDAVSDDQLWVADQPHAAYVGDVSAGTLRTTVWSPRLGRFVGLALLDIAHTEPGTVLEVDAPGIVTSITVSAAPFGVSL